MARFILLRHWCRAASSSINKPHALILHNVVVFASSSGADFSIENPEWGHGAFSKALIDGLSGEAAYKKGVVKLSYLQDYVRETVRELTNNAQTPTIPKITGSGEFF